MKSLAIIFFTFILIGCSGGGGGSDEIPESSPSVSIIPSSATTVPLVIIQVEFDNFTFNSSTSTWNQKIFGSVQGQLNHYFLEISQNSFAVIPANESESSNNDGIIKVHLNINHPDPNFQANDGSGLSNFQTQIAIPALSKADPFIDFSSYDKNSNNQIDVKELQIMFLVAGGEQATIVHPSIWAHQSYIGGINHDGVSLMQYPTGSYTAFGERHFNINGPDASIGIIAHELGHGVFNLPDLYDTDESSEGIGFFGLMGAGSWGYIPGKNPGEVPVHMSAWSKIKANFITPEIVTVTSNNHPLNATNLSSYKPIKLITQNSNQYFLIENRSSLGYDAGLYVLDDVVGSFQGGIAIWHIDESKTNNSNEANRIVDLEESDSTYLDSANQKGNQTNLYYQGNPAGAYSGVFSKNSLPSSDLYSNVDTNITIDASLAAIGPTMLVDIIIAP